MQTIKIISGYSGPGGSTQIWINLTNLLNEYGYNAIFYGPQTFHKPYCKSGGFEDVIFDKDDILIMHVVGLNNRPDVKKVIYASHEKWWGEITDDMVYWDIAVFNHQKHREFHSKYTGPYVYIPNPKSILKSSLKPELDLIAGVIGTIEERKQTHLSIERALNDGCTKIKLYGMCNTNTDYYKKYMLKYEDDDRVEFIGYVDTKQQMYDSIGRVYHSSIGEVSCLVKDECQDSGTKFFGNEETEHIISSLSNVEIIKLWEQLWDKPSLEASTAGVSE